MELPEDEIRYKIPWCCNEPMQPTYTYKSGGHLYRRFRCNNRACIRDDQEVRIT
jgi:hypothetical protein